MPKRVAGGATSSLHLICVTALTRTTLRVPGPDAARKEIVSFNVLHYDFSFVFKTVKKILCAVRFSHALRIWRNRDGEPLCDAYFDDDDFTIEDDLCYNGDFDSSAALTSCYQTFATQAELDAANCPSSCSSGYAGGPDPLTETEAAYTYEATGGWCKSPLDAQVLNDRVGFFSADQCWDACVEEFGIDVIDNVEYGCVNVVDSNLLPFSFSYDEADIDGCHCFCQSSCGCIVSWPLFRHKIDANSCVP